MSATRRIAFAVSVAWFSRALAIFSGLILIPLLWHALGREEYGLWVILGNSQVFLGLLGLGVVPTLTRHIALAKGRSGASPDVELTPETRQHIADLVATGRAVLRGLAVLGFLAAFAAGAAYLAGVVEHVSPGRVLAAWLLICAGNAVGIWVSYLDCWMVGVGHVGWSALVTAVVELGRLLANIIAALLGGGILTLAVILVASGLIQRGVLLVLLRRQAPALFRTAGRWHAAYARNLVRPSLLAWLNLLGAFLALQVQPILIAGSRGADQVPPYQSTYAPVYNLYLLAVSFAASSGVFLSQAWQAGAHESVRRQTIRVAQIGMAIMAASVGWLLTVGPVFIVWWTRQADAFIGYATLAVFCTMLTLEAQHVILATCARSTEDERYAVSGLAAGALNLLLTWWLIGPLGLLGVATATMLAQMLTNNWYAVYRPVVRLRLDLRTYLRRVVLLWAATLGGTLLTSSLLIGQLHDLGLGPAWVVGGAATCAGLTLAAALWWGVLEAPQRRRLLAFVRDRLRPPGGLGWVRLRRAGSRAAGPSGPDDAVRRDAT